MQNIIVVTNVLGALGTNCYTVVNTETRDAVVIDPAANESFLCKMFENQNYKLKAILITHAHFDHMGAVMPIKKYFQDKGIEVPVYIGENDDDLLANCATNLSAMFGEPMFVQSDVKVKDGDVIDILGTKMKCIEVPGHTKGGMCYYFEENKLLFDGDTLFKGSVGRSDFPTGDPDVLLSSIENKLFTLPDDTEVFPGHEGKTTISREKKFNMFF